MTWSLLMFAASASGEKAQPVTQPAVRFAAIKSVRATNACSLCEVPASPESAPATLRHDAVDAVRCMLRCTTCSGPAGLPPRRARPRPAPAAPRRDALDTVRHELGILTCSGPAGRPPRRAPPRPAPAAWRSGAPGRRSAAAPPPNPGPPSPPRPPPPPGFGPGLPPLRCTRREDRLPRPKQPTDASDGCCRKFY